MIALNKLTVGYAFTGSFCTFEQSVKALEDLSQKEFDIVPIMSFNAFSTDTRFGNAKDFRDRIENICNRKIISTIFEAEPIGPKKLLDLLIISPCTGNTLAKLANAIADTPVTLAAKSHLRNSRPVLLGVSSNDSLAAAAKNIGVLMARKHIYFIPMRQDDSNKKPFSVVCDFSKTYDAAVAALRREQLQPLLI